MINPLADELCDEFDNDCDAFNNADTGALGETVWYEDTDGDGYGNVASPLPVCDQPKGMWVITMIVTMETFNLSECF